MATLPLAKAGVIPMIESVRVTCLGAQYIVADPEYLYTVTINDKHILCSCGECICSHIQAVQLRRAQYAASDTRRNAYAALFDLSYGD